jgi:hypothetical protein
MPPITRASRKHRRHITSGGGSKRRWFPICTAHYSNTLFLLPALSELFQTKKIYTSCHGQADSTGNKNIYPLSGQAVSTTKKYLPLLTVKQLVLQPKTCTCSHGQAVNTPTKNINLLSGQADSSPTKNIYLFSRSSC